MEHRQADMLKKIFFIIILIAILVFGFILYNKNKNQNYLTPANLPVPTPISETDSVVSPDGKETLTMKKVRTGDTEVYSFTSNAGSYFTMETPITNPMSIPFNTWSPDNKYFFVKEASSSASNYFVINPAGAVTNVTEYFTKAYPDYILQDVTGWASPTLMIVNANTGSKDISLWFEVTSHGFTKLSNRFN